MKRASQLVLVWLVVTALLLSSCAQNLSEAPPKAETETTTTAPLLTHEPKPASFSVSGLTITPKELTAGSCVTIEVLVTNNGELPGTYDVTLNIDDTIEATEKVTLEGGASHKVIFTKTKYTARTYSVSINGQSGTFVVKAQTSLPVVQPPPPPLPPMDAFMKGMNFGDGSPHSFLATSSGEAPNPTPPQKPRSPDSPRPRREIYAYPRADQSLKDLAATGTNWVSLVVTIWQETIKSTVVTRDQYATPSDAALKRMIDLAHSLGMRVALNPIMQLSHDPNHGHIWIGKAFTTEEQWQAWFDSYRETIIYYATMAQNAGVDLLYIGNELESTIHREADWRRVAREVRQVYKGPIMYEATVNLHLNLNAKITEEQRVKWWDEVDYIGVLGYLPLTNSRSPTIEELKSAWSSRGHLKRFEALSQKFQRPIIISEIGFLSADWVNVSPTPFEAFAEAAVDFQEQADCYQATLEALWGQPWLAGIFWFQWFVNPDEPTPVGKDRNESPQGKPAEAVLRDFYQSH